MSSTPEANTSLSAPRVIDIESLLAPVASDNAAGESLQYAGLYREIGKARHADENLEQGEWKHELKTADWQEVVSLATDALATRTKDLKVGAWLAEALVKLHGFVGLRDGMRTMRGLLEQFWDNVYPEIDEGDLEARANALAWMDRQVSSAIKDVPITNFIGGEDYSFLQWQESNQFDIPENIDELSYEQRQRVEELRARAAEEDKVTGEDWRKAKNATRRSFYEDAYAIVNESWDEFQALDRVIDEKFELQTPGLGAIKKTLDEIKSLVTRLVKEKRLLEPDPVSNEDASLPKAQEYQGEGEPAFIAASGQIRTRQEALRLLGEIAEYFRRTEPHSPVAYLVQRAIKWGQMPLEIWLQDVIKDGGVLDNLRETLGLKADSNGQ